MDEDDERAAVTEQLAEDRPLMITTHEARRLVVRGFFADPHLAYIRAAA